MNQTYQLLKKIEPYLFLILCIINCIPVLQSGFFATMDGGAHLYNSNLINELLFGDSEIIASYFKINPEPVPNYTGHIILSFFNLFLPAFYAEKIVVLFYLIGLPISFRALIKTVRPKGIIASYFIFPFTYTSVFLLGFYNYSIAIVFLFIAIRYWLLNHHHISNYKTFFTFFILVCLVYFSHIFVFSVLLLFLTIHFIVNLTSELLEKKIPPKKTIIVNLKKASLTLLFCLIPLICFFYYFISRQEKTINKFLDSYTLVSELKTIRTIIAYNSHLEEVFTKKIFYIFSIITVIALYLSFSKLLKRFKRSNKKISNKNLREILWSIMGLSMLILYFKMPDSDGSGGFISVRIALFIFLFLIIYISTQKLKKWLLFVCVLGVLHFTYKLHEHYFEVIADQNKRVESCYLASEYIDENSLVLPLNYTDNWLAGHYSNYLGSEKPMVILENYEADQGYFPLLWNHDEIPNAKLKDLNSKQLYCLYWKNNPQNSLKIIDYVFVLGNLTNPNEGCELDAKNHILEHYTRVFYDQHCELYKLK